MWATLIVNAGSHWFPTLFMKAGLLHGLELADLAMLHILLGLGVSVGLER